VEAKSIKTWVEKEFAIDAEENLANDHQMQDRK
jgi:hypothetical protein